MQTSNFYERKTLQMFYDKVKALKMFVRPQDYKAQLFTVNSAGIHYCVWK